MSLSLFLIRTHFSLMPSCTYKIHTTHTKAKTLIFKIRSNKLAILILILILMHTQTRACDV